jgi:uncharacterized repeat protein (TIGR03803 family)
MFRMISFLRALLMLMVVVAAATATAGSAEAGFRVLYDFPADGNDGSRPEGGLVMDKAGNLYGTTFYGGGNCNCGVVYKLAPDGTETVLHRFLGRDPAHDGSHPEGSLLLRNNGTLYGTTSDGGKYCSSTGCGTVFELAPSGTYKILHRFRYKQPDGAFPISAVIMDAGRNLYGVTTAGGSDHRSTGALYKISPQRTETILLSFGTDVAANYPMGPPVFDDSRNLYLAAAGYCCTHEFGSVIEVAPDGTPNVLYSFAGGVDGASPQAGVILDRSGNVYGTTEFGGGNSACEIGCGTVFKIAPDGAETILHAFQGGHDGERPMAGLVMDSTGNLYGTTLNGGLRHCTTINHYKDGCGTVFEITPEGTKITLHQFTGGADGAFPISNLILDKHGRLYGTTEGIETTGPGSVFVLSPPA